MIPYNRIVIIAFALAVVAVAWAVLNRTRLGLFVRATTQNRTMAACVGVRTWKSGQLRLRASVPASPGWAAARCPRSAT